MPLIEHPLKMLEQYLPPYSFESVVKYIHEYKVHLTVTRQRKTVLGDYRNAHANKNHRISVNGNLNVYEFLITLLHELAHLLTFEQFGNRVKPHGKEWKNNFRILLSNFIQQNIFPADIEQALKQSIINPAATANGETGLLLILKKYNTANQKFGIAVADIPDNGLFKTKDDRVFKKIKKNRKRYECLELATNKRYSFSAIAEVNPIQPQ